MKKRHSIGNKQMKRAFSLTELIFVIVVIGILAAIAIPKYTNLKKSAEISNAIKNSFDIVKEAVETATNRKFLENQRFSEDFNLTDIVQLSAKGWICFGKNGYRYQITNGSTRRNVILIDMEENSIKLTIRCYNFFDTSMQKKCKELIGGKPGWMSLEERFPY